jgi:hypothetical protein
MKKDSLSLAIKKIQIKTSLLLESLLSRKKRTINVGENVWKTEPSYTVGGNVN